MIFSERLIKILFFSITPVLLYAQFISPDKFKSVLFIEQEEVIGARAAGMGNAFTAAVNNVSAMRVNPAGLAKSGSGCCPLHG